VPSSTSAARGGTSVATGAALVARVLASDSVAAAIGVAPADAPAPARGCAMLRRAGADEGCGSTTTAGGGADRLIWE
jgi:hypothetical protein